MNSHEIHGMVTLTMPNGIEHTISNRLILQLLEDVSRVTGGRHPIPESVYEDFPELAWFRDCESAYSDGGDHVFEVVFALVRGPVETTPAERGTAA